MQEWSITITDDQLEAEIRVKAETIEEAQKKLNRVVSMIADNYDPYSPIEVEEIERV